MNNKNIRFVFWGTDEFSIGVIEVLAKSDLLPTLIITVPDKPKGRKLVLTPSPLRAWAEKNNIECVTPSKLSDESFINDYKKHNFEVAIVASYGKIIPTVLLDIPKAETLNVHPSLLPEWRGPSPLQSTIIHDNRAGVSIMRLDEKMDHGPIIAQEIVPIENCDNNPPSYEKLRDVLAQKGGEILTKILAPWIAGEIKEIEQDESKATYCREIEKEDGLINLMDSASLNIRKIRAYSMWPRAYAYIKNGDGHVRIIIKEAHVEQDILVLDRVIPEGGKEMDFSAFKRGYLK